MNKNNHNGIKNELKYCMHSVIQRPHMSIMANCAVTTPYGLCPHRNVIKVGDEIWGSDNWGCHDQKNRDVCIPGVLISWM